MYNETLELKTLFLFSIGLYVCAITKKTFHKNFSFIIPNQMVYNKRGFKLSNWDIVDTLIESLNHMLKDACYLVLPSLWLQSVNSCELQEKIPDNKLLKQDQHGQN